MIIRERLAGQYACAHFPQPELATEETAGFDCPSGCYAPLNTLNARAGEAWQSGQRGIATLGRR